jgi:hypothetical protein
VAVLFLRSAIRVIAEAARAVAAGA